MNSRIMARLAAMEPRVLLLLMGSVLVFLALEGWLLVLRQPVSDYRRLHDGRSAMARPETEPSRLQAEAGRIEGELAALTVKLQGQGPPLAVDRLVVYLIERLDRIAARHGVRLDSVRPGATRRVLMFDEVSSDIKLTGKYDALYEWLRDAEEELGPLVVTQFSMKITDAASGTLAMDLKLAAYRPAATGTAKQ